MNINLLKLNWLSLLEKLEVDRQTGETFFIELVNAYCAPGRYHHNLNHIQQVLNLIEEVKEIVNSIVVVQLSAWFHDSIYVAKSNIFG